MVLIIACTLLNILNIFFYELQFDPDTLDNVVHFDQFILEMDLHYILKANHWSLLALRFLLFGSFIWKAKAIP